MAMNPIAEALYRMGAQKRQRRLDEQDLATRKDQQSQQGIANLLSLMRASGGNESPAGRDFGARAGSEMGLGPLSPDYFKADEEAVNKEAQIMAEATKLVALFNKTIDRDPVTDEVTVIPGLEGINRLIGASLQKLVGAATPTDPRSLMVHGPDDSKDLSPFAAPAGGRTDQIATDLGRPTRPPLQLPSTARVGPPKSSAGPAQYGNELMEMYEMILGGPKARPPSKATATGDYDYAAARAAGAKPDERGHWPSEFKRDTHPNLIIDGLNTKTANLSQVIEVYVRMAVKQLGPEATKPKIIALAKKLAKDKGWKIDE